MYGLKRKDKRMYLIEILPKFLGKRLTVPLTNM